jgi:GT2 family glycosyltransferase
VRRPKRPVQTVESHDAMQDQGPPGAAPTSAAPSAVAASPGASSTGATTPAGTLPQTRPEARPASTPATTVTVVVCNYNGEQHLGPCLDSILGQTHPIDELLVIDNASTDSSLRVVAERCPRARVIQLRENHGPCPARNAGLRAARNAWVLLVDNDAVLESDVLAKLVTAAGTGCAIVQPRSVFANEPGTVHYDGGRLHYVGLFSLRNFHCPMARAEGSGTVEVDGVVSVVLLVDRKLILRSGGFDESFFILFEDLDLSLRLRLAGHRLLSAEDAVVLHRGGTPGISFRTGRDYPWNRAFFHSRNRWLTLAKNYRWRTLLVALPGLCAYELVWLAFTLRTGTFGAYLAGKWSFLRHLPAALHYRRGVQEARKLNDRDLLVGGPLTIAPDLAHSNGARRVLRTLDRTLQGWWRIARRWSG